MSITSIKQKLGIGSLKNFAMINAGLLLIAVGLHFFRNPNKFAMGGISGLAIVMGYFFPALPIGNIMLFINIALLVIALIFLGREFVIKTVYCSLAISFLVIVLERFIPINTSITGNMFMELIYSVFLPGVGIALVLNNGATTGGTDIIAKILTKYFKFRISISLLLSDLLIVIASVFVFGIEVGLYSFMGLMMSTFVVDSFLESLEIRKIMVIVSDKSPEIEEHIRNTIKRGATVHEATGSYSSDKKRVITTVVTRNQAKNLQAYIKGVDSNAFITITNSSSIIGSGFKSFD